MEIMLLVRQAVPSWIGIDTICAILTEQTKALAPDAHLPEWEIEGPNRAVSRTIDAGVTKIAVIELLR